MKTMSMVCAVAALACLPAARASAASCESLATLALKDTAITKAEVVAAGTFQPPGGPERGPNPYATLGTFCRVAATLTPTSVSVRRAAGGRAPEFAQVPVWRVPEERRRPAAVVARDLRVRAQRTRAARRPRAWTRRIARAAASTAWTACASAARAA